MGRPAAGPGHARRRLGAAAACARHRKLGRLLLTDGQWNGRQVLPAGWAAQSIRPRVNGEGIYFYGYQWWLGRSFRNGGEITWAAGFGYGGQRLYIVPALDLVVMINAGHYGGPLQSTIPPPASSRRSCCQR